MRLSPATRRRLAIFRQHRRGYVSFWLFLAVFGTSLFAEFIANDRPLLVTTTATGISRCCRITQETFGRTSCRQQRTTATRREGADQRKGLDALAADPVRLSHDSRTCLPGAGAATGTRPARHRRPGARRAGAADLWLPHLGAVRAGSDAFRRSSVSRPEPCRAISAASSICYSRFIEIWEGMPVLYLLIILATFVEPNFWWLLGLMLLFRGRPGRGRARRVFAGRNFDYVRAARALGVSDPVIWRHVLPNATVATITFLPFVLNGSITTLTSLDFLGFGLPPGSAVTRRTVAQASEFEAPWLGFTAFFVLVRC